MNLHLKLPFNSIIFFASAQLHESVILTSLHVPIFWIHYLLKTKAFSWVFFSKGNYINLENCGKFLRIKKLKISSFLLIKIQCLTNTLIFYCSEYYIKIKLFNFYFIILLNVIDNLSKKKK
jgi:hypothetical protein